MRKFDLDVALAQFVHMRNFKIRQVRDECVFSAQFPADSGMWALEVAFTQYGKWGWRTGARNLPRWGWELLAFGDSRARDFAIRVAERLRADAEQALAIATDAVALARSHE